SLLRCTPSSSSPSQSFDKGSSASRPWLPPGFRPQQLAAANQHLQPGCSSDKLDGGELGRAHHPPTLQMVKEALQALDEKKGASAIAIRRFILAKYPTVDSIRLKYLLKRALSKGLSCGDLVRHNSSSVGATGTFKVLAGPVDSPLSPPVKRDCQGAPGAVAAVNKLTLPGPPRLICCPSSTGAAKKQPKAKPVNVSRGQQQGWVARPSGAPKAASHRQAPRKGRSGPSTAQAAENAGGSDSDSSASAAVKGPQKAPRGKTKVKVPKEAQQDAPKAQGSQGQAKKPRVTPGAGQGKARMKKAASVAADKKAP
uniref:H1.8 linker histone n=1 Tax=Taeniopygia guttata TaxID=59729 RepID=A0A674GP33_TAEGU